MRRIRSKDSLPEMAIRRLIHHMGYRYRLHGANLPGKPDLIFPARNKVIFVHGCFWHQHKDAGCKIAHDPRSNLAYWQPKLERNRARDSVTYAALQAAGWKVFVIWECEVEARDLHERVAAFLEN